MAKRKHSPEEIVKILKEYENSEKSVEEVCRKNNISQGAFYKWKKEYYGMTTVAVRKLKELEKENQSLKRMLAETMLEKDAIQSVLKKL